MVKEVFFSLNKQKYSRRRPWSASHLRLALLAVHDLGRDDLGGGGLGSGAHAFGLGDDHLGDGSGGRDDRRLGALDGLQALLTLKHTKRGGAAVTLQMTSQLLDRSAEILSEPAENISLVWEGLLIIGHFGALSD